MRTYFLFFLLFAAHVACCQKKNFVVVPVPLPADLADPNNQVSGLFIKDKKLFFLCESRLQEKAEAKMYAAALADIDRILADSNYVFAVKKIPIYFLDSLRRRMKAAGDDYEGLEAMNIDGTDIYFSVETATPSNNCYLLKGLLTDSSVTLNPDFLVKMPKPVAEDGSHIYNAGFEALLRTRSSLCAVFEYNSFNSENQAVVFTPWSFRNSGKYHTMAVEPLPFRITDITASGKNRFTAINYFYKGGGDDSVYRVPASDKKNDALIRNGNGYHNYCRLMDLSLKGNTFTWTASWEFPLEFSGYNWEGLAAYRNGFFVVNDKYTPTRPYRTTLLFLRPGK